MNLSDKSVVELGKNILLHGFRDFSGDTSAVEEVVDEARAVVVIILEHSFDFSGITGSGEGNEANFTSGGVNSNKGTVVDAVDDGLDIASGTNVDPSATLAAAVGGVSVGFDVEDRTGEASRFGCQEGLEHGVASFSRTFTIEFSNEDTEGASFAGTTTGRALVTEGLGITFDATPRNLTLGGLGDVVVVIDGGTLDVFGRGEDGNEGVALNGFHGCGGVGKGSVGLVVGVGVVHHHHVVFVGSGLLLLLMIGDESRQVSSSFGGSREHILFCLVFLLSWFVCF